MNRQLELEDDGLHVLVQDTIERWRDGESPDAKALLNEHPALSRYKSLAMDLIYEEYCLRREKGDTLVPSTFCDRFPHYRQSISRMLEVHQALEDDPELRAQATAEPWPQIGQSFMGFELIESLGRGSLARVYLARETAVGNRLVVVKVSRNGASEAQMLGKAAHPSIVPILSVRHDDGTGWTAICMPFLGTATGTDLLEAAFADGRPPARSDVIARVAGQFRPVGVASHQPTAAERRVWRCPYSDGAARFGLHLAEGLQAAHAVGVMHRDIKPSNVLLAWSGRPMLLDFNLSSDINLKSYRVGGTLAYMAPELIEALAADRKMQARRFDPRADIYSLGAVLYELATGQLPFKPQNAERLAVDDAEPWLAAHRERLVSPRELNPRLDAKLEAAILRCLAANPDERPATAAELADDLRAYFGWPRRAVRGVRRHRRALLLAAAGAAIAAVSGGIYVSRLPPLEQRLYAQGLSQYDRGQFAAAAETFSRCLELKPDWPEARFARGQAFRQNEDFAAARAEFLALKDFDRALAFSLAAYCDIRMDNVASAERLYALPIQDQTQDSITWTNAGICLVHSGNILPAIRYFDRAIELDDANATAHYRRAMAKFSEAFPHREPVDAGTLDDAERACKLEPHQADFHFHAAIIGAYSLSLSDSPSLRARAADHLRQALELGYPAKALDFNEPILRPILGEISLEPANPPPGPVPQHVRAGFLSPSETADLSDFLRRS